MVNFMTTMDHAQTEQAAEASRALHRIWPLAVVAFGLGLTAAWTCLLGYGLVFLIGYAI
jgi:hypothetical protein